MELVLYTKKDGYGLLTINRPKQFNALNSQVLDELHSVLEQIKQENIHSLIITGAGERSFVAGADISEMMNMTKSEAAAYASKGNAVMQQVETLPIPTIAAVNGFALGGGCELALACDIRLASEKAIFAMPETGLGITPGFGGTQRLQLLVGIAVAKELIFTGRKINAAEAYRIGLINRIVDKEVLLTEAEKLAAEICQNAPCAVRSSKKAIMDSVALEQGIASEIEQFSDCFNTLDQKEAMAAFVENRDHRPFQNA